MGVNIAVMIISGLVFICSLFGFSMSVYERVHPGDNKQPLMTKCQIQKEIVENGEFNHRPQRERLSRLFDYLSLEENWKNGTDGGFQIQKKGRK